MKNKTIYSITSALILFFLIIIGFQNCSQGFRSYVAQVNSEQLASQAQSQESLEEYTQKVDMIVNRCNNCHQHKDWLNSENLKSYIIPGEPLNSKVFIALSGGSENPKIADMSANASDMDREIVQKWIELLKPSNKTTVSFALYVKPIINNQCLSCHESNSVIDLSNRTSILNQGLVLGTDSEHGLFIEAAKAIVNKTSTTHFDYTNNQATATLTVEDFNILKDWITTGSTE